eukprot:m.105268 g.105268  ORF g.105268 m.105268 type:complete len:383 (+) comp15702_c0_seq1:24-1172(+)
MGVRRLLPYLRKHCPRVFRRPSLPALDGRVVALDTSIFLHKYIHTIDAAEGDLVCVDRFVSQYAKLRSFGIRPVYVLDGEKHTSKLPEHNRRQATEERGRLNQLLREQRIQSLQHHVTVQQQQQRQRDAEQRQQVQPSAPPPLQQHEEVALVRQALAGGVPKDEQVFERLLEDGSGEPLRDMLHTLRETHQRSVDRATREVTGELHAALLDRFVLENIPFVHARHDAEKAAGWLARRNLVDVVITDDTDALPFGSPVVLRRIFTQEAEALMLKEVLSELRMTMEQFVDFCILCGTDYTTTTLKGVGPVRAFTLIHSYGSLQRYLNSEEALDKEHVNNSSFFEHELARHMFLDDSVQVTDDQLDAIPSRGAQATAQITFVSLP